MTIWEAIGMGSVKVYYFRAYDIERDRMIRSKRPATLSAIRALGPMMQPLMETEEEIDASHLDADGFRRKPTTRELVDIISGKATQKLG
jgi:hypothetical protein